MRVNPEKGVWYCPVCSIGGDAIAFIQKAEGLTFREARVHLGLAGQPVPTRSEITKREMVRRASNRLSAWRLSTSAKIGERLRELGNEIYMAKKILKEHPLADAMFLQGEIEKAKRKWTILSALESDVLDPKQTPALWESRETIERLVGTSPTYSNEEIESAFPPLTDGYKKRLTGYVRGEA